MRRAHKLFLAIWTAFCLLTADSLYASNVSKRVILKDGQTIEGPVLKESDSALFIDLGFEILRLPRPQIERILDKVLTSAESGLTSAIAAPNIRTLPYQLVDALPENVGRQDLINRVKEAVVIVSNPKGMGSGFFIDYEGHIVTNKHVAGKSKYQKVTLLRKEGGELRRKRIEEVEVKAYSELLDIALLKIKEKDLKDLDIRPLPVYSGIALTEGEQVYAVGNPGLGGKILEHSVTNGIISSPNRNFNDILYMQTTAPVNPGNSGGPLVNTRGEVIGLVTFKAFFQEGIAFALPSNYLHHFLQNQKAYSFGKNNPNSGFRYLDPEVEPEEE
jgi:serine protease Do